MLHKVDILGLTLDQDSKTPILVLKTVDTEETIPIWIGLLEATSIASALQNVNFDRPMTHDLFKNFIQQVDVDLERIEVCDLKENTFFARIHFVSGNHTFSMDARPSDAIALSVRFNAPVFVDKSVIQALTRDKTYEMEDDSEEGKKWAEYLAKLSPDDFGKYEV
ncbi:MAG: bifunctional nuclease family protein [Thermodesulfobacteriota bacterium]|nr:bifunctional nuclease family protein [Thermodesulfobacteriota bacterium]